VKQAEVCFASGDYKGCFEAAVAVRDVDSEHVQASVLLADLYHHGNGVARNVAEAMACYEVGARRGDAHAIVNLGHLHYEQGNMQQAQQLFEKVSETGNPIANYNLWMIYRDQGDWARAQACLEVAAEAGDIDAKFKLSLLYATKGKGKGKQLLDEIGDRFDELHDYDLLEASLGGREDTAFISYNMAVKKEEAGDLVEAKRLYLKASNNGFGDASYNLGCIHRREGRTREALHFLGIASDKGVHEATFTLPLMQKVDGNVVKAMSLCDLAIEQGSTDAISTLASMHERGGDLAKAKYYYGVAAGKGCPYGLKGMRRMSASEAGVTFLREFNIGDRVQIHGLLTEPGKVFNGKQGIMFDHAGFGDRCKVRIDGHENVKSIKYANLQHASSLEESPPLLARPFCNGDRVIIQALQNHRGQALNGKYGTVVGATETGRWSVKVDGLDGTKCLKERTSPQFHQCR
jgi:TPR repeat protein/ribosomal protein L21E